MFVWYYVSSVIPIMRIMKSDLSSIVKQYLRQLHFAFLDFFLHLEKNKFVLFIKFDWLV